MIPVKLQLHNFLSYKEPKPLDLQSFNLAVLSGNNGVGKSSILEAITWAVWGQTRATSDDELIHQGEQGMWVEFIFEHEGGLYRIVRKREFKKNTGQSFLELQTKTNKKLLLDDVGWQSIAEATLKATNEKIIRILKIPYEIFVNSSYLRQGHADEFTIKTPAERKEILSEVLDLNFYEELSQKARQKGRSSEEKIKMLTFQIEDLQEQVVRKGEVEKQLGLASERFDQLSKKHQGLKETIRSLEKLSREYEIISERLENLRNQFDRLRTEAKNLDADKEKIIAGKNSISEQLKNKAKILKSFAMLEVLEKQNDEANLKFRKLAEILQELRGLENLKAKLNEDVTRIKKIAVCPMCRRPMKKQEASEIVVHLEKEFNQKYNPRLKKLHHEIKKLNYDESFHTKAQKKLEELAASREQKQILDLAENNLKNAQVNLKNIQERLAKIKNEAEKISREGKNLKTKQLNLEKVSVRWQEKKAEEEQIANQVLELQNLLGGLRQELIQIQAQEQELKSFQKESLDFQKEIANYEELASAFGKKGIQAMIIETALSSIEEGANGLLGKITDGRMSLKFITQKAKKAPADEDELIETLEIKIADELGERDYEMYSGGEAFRINFAIRIALSKLLAARAGTHLKFLAIDESFGMLDSAGRDDLVAAINSIAGEFEKILVITHLQELKDLFPTKIEVTKNENGSQIELIS